MRRRSLGEFYTEAGPHASSPSGGGGVCTEQDLYFGASVVTLGDIGQRLDKGVSMIYKREEFIEEADRDGKYPLKQVEQLSAVDGSGKRFVGHVSLAVETPMGVSTIPVSFEIQAAGIAQAFEKFDARADEEVEKTKGELQSQFDEMRRKAQSRIVTPDEVLPGGMGKIKL